MNSTFLLGASVIASLVVGIVIGEVFFESEQKEEEIEAKKHYSQKMK